ncbi:hypothetical protein AVEN_7517-1 [Araneus ventricosus]|uniref:Integrase zinc-binding domain-containing protein n=1 Tax=Araneus ventricosus TaxID=182803 RepID=A0A4Y2NHZ9_ARAVE|nr:hypothetical protein AVEN_7517-1 [Araneus ventricosus]
METCTSVKALTMTAEDIWYLSQIQKVQLEDPYIRPILKRKLNSAGRPSCKKSLGRALQPSLHLKGGVLFRKWENKDGNFYRQQLILPKTRIQEVLRETHDNIRRGQFGVIKTFGKTRERFYWD